MPEPELRCQELVIGSGPGGSVTASLLAEHRRDVILLEEGADLPLESCAPFSIEEMLQKYRAGGITVGLGAPKIAFVEGRVAGGGSEVNSGLYHRTPPPILDLWKRDYQVQALDPEHLDPHFSACEKTVHVCSLPTPASLASRKLAQGAEAFGWNAQEVPRWFRYDGTVGSDGVAQGTRQSMSKTFLQHARQNGVRLLTRARACRLEQKNDDWIAHFHQDGVQRTVRAHQVFVCAGAVHSPLLLRASGLTRNIGNTLAMHPTIKVLARFPEELNHEDLGVPVHQVKQFSPRMSFGCSISSLPYLMLAMVDYPDHRIRIRDHWRHMANYYAMITGPTTGRIRSLPFSTEPLIRYPLTPPDLYDLSIALRRLCQMLFAAGAVELFPSISGIEPLTHPGQISRLPHPLPRQASNLMSIHVFSSCPMGEDQRVAACDSFGRIHGLRGLSVHDASLICTAPGVNPQGTVMALAHRNTSQYIDTLQRE